MGGSLGHNIIQHNKGYTCYHVASACIKIDTSLVVYRLVTLCNDVNNNVAYIHVLANYNVFT